MTSDLSPRSADASLAAEAAEIWVRASDGVLCGLNHNLTNRIYALDLFMGHLESGATIDASVRSTVAAEVGRLELLLRRYRLMERSDGAPEEPVRVADILPDVVELFKSHLALRDIPCTLSGDLSSPPALAAPATLAKALLLLLCAAARQALAGGEIVVTHTGDASAVSVQVDITQGEGAHAGTPEEPEELRAVRWMLRDAAVQTEWRRIGTAQLRASVRIGSLTFLRTLRRAG